VDVELDPLPLAIAFAPWTSTQRCNQAITVGALAWVLWVLATRVPWPAPPEPRPDDLGVEVGRVFCLAIAVFLLLLLSVDIARLLPGPALRIDDAGVVYRGLPWGGPVRLAWHEVAAVEHAERDLRLVLVDPDGVRTRLSLARRLAWPHSGALHIPCELLGAPGAAVAARLEAERARRSA
jgi:hypothetical protein